MKAITQSQKIVRFFLTPFTLTLGCATLLTGCAIAPFVFGPHGDEDPIAEAAQPFIDNAERVTWDQDSLATHASSANRAPSSSLHAGMSMDQVRAIWGRPLSSQVAGDPSEGNEKWIYPAGISGRYGIGSQRVVYLEKGKLAGWEN